MDSLSRAIGRNVTNEGLLIGRYFRQEAARVKGLQRYGSLSQWIRLKPPGTLVYCALKKAAKRIPNPTVRLEAVIIALG